MSGSRVGVISVPLHAWHRSGDDHVVRWDTSSFGENDIETLAGDVTATTWTAWPFCAGYRAGVGGECNGLLRRAAACYVLLKHHGLRIDSEIAVKQALTGPGNCYGNFLRP